MEVKLSRRVKGVRMKYILGAKESPLSAKKLSTLLKIWHSLSLSSLSSTIRVKIDQDSL